MTAAGSADDDAQRERIFATIRQYGDGENDAYRELADILDHQDKMLTWGVGLMGAAIFPAAGVLRDVMPWTVVIVSVSPWVLGIIAAVAARLVAEAIRSRRSLWHYERAISIRSLLLEADHNVAIGKLHAIVQRDRPVDKQSLRLERRLVRVFDGLYYAAHVMLPFGLVAVLVLPLFFGGLKR